MNARDLWVWSLVEKAALTVTDETTGQFDNNAFTAEVRSRLEAEDVSEEVRAVSVEMLAKSLASGFVRRRNPKPGKPSGMFDFGAILPLGKGKRVWMEYATDADLIEWARLSTKNLARVAAAEGARQAYVTERLDAMRDHSGWLLGRIERELFGFSEANPQPDYSDLADEDDWGGE